MKLYSISKGVFRSRGVATGITGSVSFFLIFLASKSYYNLEAWLSLPGVAAVYAIVSLVGLVVCYYILPETENRTLEDIEMHFSDNSRSLADREIAKNVVRGNLQTSHDDDDDQKKTSATISQNGDDKVVVNMFEVAPTKAETNKNKNGGISNKSFVGDS